MRDTEDMGDLDTETIQPKPAPRAVARPVRATIAAIVVLASAGVGFLASHIWPLTGFSGQGLQVASTSSSKTFEPPMSSPAVAVQEAKVAEPSSSTASRPVEQPDRAAPANLADEPQHESKGEPKSEPSDRTQNTANGFFAVLDERTAKPSTADEERSGTPEPRASKNERTEVARRETASKKKSSRVAQGQRSPVAGRKMAKSAAASTNFRNNPVLKEFMSSPLRF